MIQIYLKDIHCHEETDEVGADEPYVLVTSVNLASTVSVKGFPVPLPAFDVKLYGPFDDMDDEETHAAPGSSQSFWGVTGASATLSSPEKAIFIVSLMENDDGDANALRGVVKGVVGGSIFGSLTLNRDDTVAALLRDIRSAMRTPTGAPNFDDVVGADELVFSSEELARAASGEVVVKSLHINGDGGRYELRFEAVNTAFKGFELAPADSAAPSSAVAAASRATGTMEIWWVGANGSIQDAYWYEGQQGWKRFEIAPAGSASTQGGITAVSRAPGTMEIWWVGANGSIHDAFWYEGQKGWRHYELSPGGTASTAGGLASVSRMAESMEVWFVGSNGSIQDRYWYQH